MDISLKSVRSSRHSKPFKKNLLDAPKMYFLWAEHWMV